MKAPEDKTILLSEVYVDPNFNCRKGINEENVQSLADSIREFGLQTPICVMVVRRKDYKYQLISGHRRFKAHQLLGKTEIAARVYECTKREAHILNLVENIERKKISILEEALGLLACFSKKTSLTEMARVLKRNISWVKIRWHLANCHPFIQDLFMQGILKPTDLPNLSGRCENPKRRVQKYFENKQRTVSRQTASDRIMMRLRNKLMETNNTVALAVLDWMRGDIPHPQLWKVIESEQTKNSSARVDGEIHV